MGFVVDKAALGQVFSECFGFSCQAFHRLLHTLHHPSSSIIIRGWYDRPVVASVMVDSVPLQTKREMNGQITSTLVKNLTEVLTSTT
jgi:hypothetical protein